jgi:hypothetical protein
MVNLGELHPREYGHLLASHICMVKDFDLAEDSLQEAFAAAPSWCALIWVSRPARRRTRRRSDHEGFLVRYVDCEPLRSTMQ